MPAGADKVSDSSDSMPERRDILPRGGDQVPTTGNSMPAGGDSMSTAGYQVPNRSDKVSGCGYPMPSATDNLSKRCNGVCTTARRNGLPVTAIPGNGASGTTAVKFVPACVRARRSALFAERADPRSAGGSAASCGATPRRFTGLGYPTDERTDSPAATGGVGAS